MLLIAVRGGFIPDDESAIPCLDHGFERGMIRNDENVFPFFVSMFISRLFLHMFKDFLSEVYDLLFSGETTILVSADLTLDLLENFWSKTCFSH